MPGRTLLKCVGNDESAARILEDFFRKKATATLKTRIGSMNMFVAWVKTKYASVQLLPIEEEAVYQYACYCRDQRKSASRVQVQLQIPQPCKIFTCEQRAVIDDEDVGGKFNAKLRKKCSRDAVKFCGAMNLGLDNCKSQKTVYMTAVTCLMEHCQR